MTDPAPPTFYPVLRYADAAAAIDWLERALGFDRLHVTTDADGGVAHAELRFGRGVVMLGTARDDADPVPGAGPMSARRLVYVHVEGDIDAHHDRARAAGADVVMELRDMDYGSREYAARDPEGHLWSFGTYAPDLAGRPSA
jgi:uncharacterized glyoxalase superfamily protein PhnB